MSRLFAGNAGWKFELRKMDAISKVFSNHLDGVLTIPAHKPIKPVYIRHVAALASAHLAAARNRNLENGFE